MNRIFSLAILFMLFLFTACAPQAELSHDHEESTIVLSVEDEMASITLNALMINEAPRPSDEHQLHWHVNDETILEVFSEPELIEDARNSFSVGGGERYMISETYLLDEPLDAEQVSGGIDAIVTDEEGNEVHSFTFENVIAD